LAVGLMVVHRGRGPDGAAHTVAAPGEHVGQAFTRLASVTDQPRVDPHIEVDRTAIPVSAFAHQKREISELERANARNFSTVQIHTTHPCYDRIRRTPHDRAHTSYPLCEAAPVRPRSHTQKARTVTRLGILTLSSRALTHGFTRNNNKGKDSAVRQVRALGALDARAPSSPAGALAARGVAHGSTC
jgi:hypothetical protein